MKELLLIYELSQVDLVCERYRRAKDTSRIVALNFWVERELARRGVPFESFSEYKLSDTEAAQWLERARTVAREWYRLPEISYLEHNGIRLAEAVEPAFDSYMQIVFYYLAPLDKLFANTANLGRVLVLHKGGEVASTAGPFSLFEVNAVLDVCHYLAKRHGYEVETLGTPTRGAPEPFPPQPLTHKLLSLWNVCMRLVPSKRLKIFASETWSHIAPFVGRMENLELVLMDRAEAARVPKREIVKHRMRFIHPLTWYDRAVMRRAQEAQKMFAARWGDSRGAVGAMSELVYNGESLWPLLSPAFDWFVERYVARLVYEAASFECIFKRERIQKLLLRVSVSMHQSHFFIAAKVARSLGIVSIELQHAGAVLDPKSPHSRLEADYLAAYGSYTAALTAKHHGYAPERLRAVGSPRFDRYLEKSVLSAEGRASALAKVGLDPQRPVILIATPADNVVLIPHEFDSYGVANLFEAAKRLHDATGAQVLFKFRSQCPPSHKAYIDELFGDKDVAIATDDLYYRIQSSDIVLSCNSTAMYETMMAHKPLVLYPWRKTDELPLETYTQAAPVAFGDTVLAAEVARILSDEMYRQERVARQDAFLRDNYSFDGNSWHRIQAMLEENLAAPR